MPRSLGVSGVFTSSFLPLIALYIAICGIFSPQKAAAEDSQRAFEGYVTGLFPPSGFAVNGVNRVTTTASTTYRWFGSKGVENAPAPADALQVGVFVQVIATEQGGILRADSVRLRDMGDKTLKGNGLIDKVLATGPEPVFRADVFRIRITSGTVVKFSGRLKVLADVSTNDWVQYEGKLDKTGDLIATDAEFSAGKTGTKKAGQLAKDAAIPDAIPANAAIVDADGNFKGAHDKVRLGDSGGVCGWHRLAKDQALQQRVQRVGLSVVPSYQNDLALNEAEKIHFRFYAVDDPKHRSELACNSGLILIPQQVAERFKSDDQLATVLADGVAFYLQIQSKKLIAEGRELNGVFYAGLAANAFAPGIDIATTIGPDIAIYIMKMELEEQRSRMALALMDDAGYDPWAAPEAWRLLAPKELPTDLDSLKYPDRSGYQLALLNQQYRKDGTAKSATTQGTVDYK